MSKFIEIYHQNKDMKISKKNQPGSNGKCKSVGNWRSCKSVCKGSSIYKSCSI